VLRACLVAVGGRRGTLLRGDWHRCLVGRGISGAFRTRAKYGGVGSPWMAVEVLKRRRLGDTRMTGPGVCVS
jgi:hypothetical protein